MARRERSDLYPGERLNDLYETQWPDTHRISWTKQMKELEAENTQMHRIIAKLTLKFDAMDDLI